MIRELGVGLSYYGFSINSGIEYEDSMDAFGGTVDRANDC